MTLRRYFIDLFACHGGCSVGYYRALERLGITVLGVDLWQDYPRLVYPFPGWKGDVLDFLRRLCWWQWRHDEAPQAWEFIKEMLCD